LSGRQLAQELRSSVNRLFLGRSGKGAGVPCRNGLSAAAYHRILAPCAYTDRERLHVQIGGELVRDLVQGRGTPGRAESFHALFHGSLFRSDDCLKRFLQFVVGSVQ
jgi:hypothetical protein